MKKVKKMKKGANPHYKMTRKAVCLVRDNYVSIMKNRDNK